MSEGFQALSEREKETLRLLLGGHDIKSIAAVMGLSVHTVNERLRDARRKLGASSSRQAARILADAEQGGPNFSGDSRFSGGPNLSADKQYGVAEATVRTANHEHSHRAPGSGQSLAWLAGGMLIMSLVIAAAVISLVLHGGGKGAPLAPTRIAAATPSSSESAGSARAWLALIDGQQWKESWSAAASAFKSHITAEDWATKGQSVVTTLGPASSRVLQKVIQTTTLPGAPDGQYEVLYFATHFAKMGDGIETVTLAHEGSSWKVDGYFISPAPAKP
jgi:DNA-binding CsgD family transcriptional regulator